MNIKEIKQKYKDEWVLVEVLKEDELNRPLEVQLVFHSKNRDEVYQKLEEVEDKKHVATFYTGDFPQKGYAVVFYGKNKF